MYLLKELTTAYYDRQTGQIYNSTPGSLIWWHEMGHSKQKINPNWQYTPLIAITLIAFGFIDYAGVAIMFYWANHILLELDAWAYAVKIKSIYKKLNTPKLKNYFFVENKNPRRTGPIKYALWW